MARTLQGPHRSPRASGLDLRRRGGEVARERLRRPGVDLGPEPLVPLAPVRERVHLQPHGPGRLLLEVVDVDKPRLSARERRDAAAAPPARKPPASARVRPPPAAPAGPQGRLLRAFPATRPRAPAASLVPTASRAPAVLAGRPHPPGHATFAPREPFDLACPEPTPVARPWVARRASPRPA